MANVSMLKRQKTILAAVAIALAVVAVVYAPEPVRAYLGGKSRVAAARQKLERVQRWHDELVAIRKSEKDLLDQARSASAQGDLWTVVNRAMQELNLQDRSNLTTAVTASTSMTQLELSVTGASLEEVVQLLHKIFSSNSMVIVQDLRELGPSKQGKGLDCRVTLLAPKV